MQWVNLTTRRWLSRSQAQYVLFDSSYIKFKIKQNHSFVSLPGDSLVEGQWLAWGSRAAATVTLRAQWTCRESPGTLILSSRWVIFKGRFIRRKNKKNAFNFMLEKW